MDIKREERGKFVVIHLSGEMEAYDAEAFEGEADEVANGPKKDVIVDLGRLTYICSSGLRVLLTLRGRLEKDGGSLCLVALNGKVLDVFRVSKLLTIFKVAENVDLAINGG